MKNKLTIILGLVFLVGLVAAAGTITNLSPSLTIPEFIAGGTTSTTFSFDYEDDGFNNPDASLVLRVNINSLDENYPVWKGDFQLSGFIEQSILPWLSFETTHPLKCVEDDAKFRVQQGLLYTETNIPNGTFYCYDPNDYIDMLELDRRDKVNLSITSDPALYPGEYSVEVELMEMEPDTSPPEIEFMIEDYVFGNTIPIKLNVTDMYEVQIVQYKITRPILSKLNYADSGWITITLDEDSGLYEDDFDTTSLEESGLYWIRAYACDVLGNCREM